MVSHGFTGVIWLKGLVNIGGRACPVIGSSPTWIDRSRAFHRSPSKFTQLSTCLLLTNDGNTSCSLFWAQRNRFDCLARRICG